MGIIHFALGGALMTLLVTLLRPSLCHPRTAVVTGGLWAMVPDGWWLVLLFNEPMAAVAKTLHTSQVANLFWFHHFLDTHEVGTPLNRAVGALALLVLLVIVVVADRRHDRHMHVE